MKREYIRPEYDSDNQLEDIMDVSVQYEVDEENQTITGIVDIESLYRKTIG